MQRLCGTDLRTLAAEDALRSVFPSAGLLVDLYVHGADTQAFPAVDAFAFIAVDAQQRKIARGCEEHRNRAQIFAECAIIFKYKSQHNTYNIVKCISSKENPEHDSLQIRDFHQKQAENHCQG